MRKLKLEIFICLVLVLMLTLVAGACAQPATTPAAPTTPTPTPPITPVKLKVAGYFPPSNQTIAACLWYCGEVEKQTGGKVKFEYYWQESLLKVYDIPSGTGKGVADCSIAVGPFTADIFPLSELIDTPYTFSTPDVAGNTLKELFDSGYAPLAAEWKKVNLKPIAVVPGASMTGMFKDKKVNYPSDFKGMKISSTGTVIADLQKMGITPVTMPPGDLYEALQRGTVDGLMRGTIDSFYTNKWYEVAKYILYPQFGASICNVTFNMNLDKWNSLPKDVQDVMMKLAPAYQDLNMKLIMEMEIKQTKDMVAKGCEAYKLTPDALKQWKDIFLPAHADDYIAAIAKKGVTNGREVFNKMIETAKTYEKSAKWLDPF